jgi:hypothetical protein
MKKLFLFIAGLLLFTKLLAQVDSLNTHGFWVRPYYENGIAFLNNGLLRKSFSTNTMFMWGAGIRFGNPGKSTILPFIQFENISWKKLSGNNYIIASDTTFRINEILIGVNVSLIKHNSQMVTAKLGYGFSWITDNLNINSGKAKGLTIGIGYEVKILKSSRIILNYSYDFNKLNHYAFRDYDIQKLTFGLVI